VIFGYSYGGRKRMLGVARDGVAQASYLYDHAGRRISSALLREYIWLDDLPLAIVAGPVATPVYYYMHMGQIGEPLMVTDAAKAKVWDAAIDPWGKPVMLSTPTVPLNLRLPGQWAQGEAGLYQNWMRDYDPALGRYAQADPLGIEAGQNVYAYVDGKPIRFTDPMGLAPQSSRYTVKCGRCILIYDTDSVKGVHTHWKCPGKPQGCVKKDGTPCDGSPPPPPEVKKCLQDRKRIPTDEKLCPGQGSNISRDDLLGGAGLLAIGGGLLCLAAEPCGAGLGLGLLLSGGAATAAQ
jgi:RHS repeat-associated protein